VKEQSISFGNNNGLIGTLCLPEGLPLAAQFGVILFNAGVVHRVGPHRINVRLARMLVQKGIPSIRFDLAGLGDSARPGADHSFETQAVMDVRCAIDELGAVTKLKQFALFGFCSGASHSYETALADTRVAGILLYDAYLYPTFKQKWNRFQMRAKQDGIPRAIARVIQNGVEEGVKHLTTKFRPGGGAFVSNVSNIAYPPKSEIASGIKKLLDRGTEVCVMQAGGSFYTYNYAQQFNDAIKRFGISGRVKSIFFPDMDHVATSIKEQHEFMREIVRWILALKPAPQTGQAENN
jgi:pimeloyl-ACP methyl ester carboxylesterase